VLATRETRLQALARELDGLNNQIRGLADDYDQLLDRTRQFQEERERQSAALDTKPKPERVDAPEQEIQDRRASTDELDSFGDDLASAADLATITERVDRLEQAPRSAGAGWRSLDHRPLRQ